MAWMETDYSKDTYFRWKVTEWRPEHLGALEIVGETAPLFKIEEMLEMALNRLVSFLCEPSWTVLRFPQLCCYFCYWPLLVMPRSSLDKTREDNLYLYHTYNS